MENKEIKSNNGIIIGAMAFIIIVLAGLCIYLFFIKKDEGVVDNNGNQQSSNIEIIKHVNCYVGDLYLDSKGAVYFSLSSEVINNSNLKQLKDRQTEYVNIVKNNNYNSDSLVGISLGQLNVKDVDYLQDGQGGYGYFTLLTKDSRLYLISDEAIEQNGIIEVIKPNKLHDIVSVGVESGDVAMSYALNKNNQKIYLNDVVDNSNTNQNETHNNDSKQLNNSVTYKSNDGKYKLTIIDKSDTTNYNKALNEFKNGYEKYHGNGEYINRNILSYGYLNNKVIEINEIVKEDETYAIVKGEYLPSVINGMCGSTITIMYNKKAKTLEIPVDAEDKFYLCTNDLSFEKINNNYYFLYYYVDDVKFIDGVESNPSKIYTDKWKQLGYVIRNNIKYDKDGIYVYNNGELNGGTLKYDFNGNMIK